MNANLADTAVLVAFWGVRVFPCRPDGKEPLTTHGFEDASADPRVVRAWWDRHPRANIGVPTGANHADVLDVDDHGDAGNGFAALRRIRDVGLAAGAHRLVRTPRGGLHLYFRPTGNRNGSLRLHHLDCRGDGGYVLIPPSIVNGKPYETLEHRPEADGTLDWAAIKELLTPTRQLSTRGARASLMTGNATALAGWLSTVKEGGRNSALFWACCRLVEAGAASLAELAPLLEVAETIGLPHAEAERTATSALRSAGGAAA